MASTPDNPSSDYVAMRPYWTMVDKLLAGADEMRKAAAYLPQFPNETPDDYAYRLANAKFTNIFGDIVDDLAAKPFAEPVTIKDGTASDTIMALAEDIDGRGNKLHVFAGDTFCRGVAYALDWIMVEYTKAKPRPDGQPLSLEDEARQGLRPYWVSIPATSMIAVYTDTIRGKEECVHARMIESVTRRKGFEEVVIERVRQFDREAIFNDFGQIIDYAPATYTLHERNATTGAWSIVDAGPISIGIIPLVGFATGRRANGSWRLNPPMKRAADQQIEHFQQETALKAAKELVAYPMLAGVGVSAPTDASGAPLSIPVGPKTVLYAPPFGDNGQHGDWKFVTVDAAGLKFLADDIKNTEQQLRELGRQPLTAQTGNLTVVTTAFAAQKGNSAIQAWALNLQDALEQAMKITAMWLGDPSQPVVTVFTDFSLDMQDDNGPDFLLTMRERGDLSRETLWSEARRRNILSAEFDAGEEVQKIEDEVPDPDAEADVIDALGDDVPDDLQEDLAA